MNKELKMEVKGMSCGHCEAKVKKAVSQIEGILSVEVSLLTSLVHVVADEKVLEKDIKKAIKNAGYQVK